MSIKNYKRGLKGPENEAIENSRHIFGKTRYPFSWKNKGFWKTLAPRKHPGWAAYHANQEKT